jgi:cation:H+ antiporter
MEMILAVPLLIIGFVILLKGADWFVDSAATIAGALGVSKFVIGFTLVAFGTSLPEMAVSVVASFAGKSAIAAGNVVGSNIANIGLVMGAAALFFTIKIKKSDFKNGAIMFLVSVLCFLLMWGGVGRVEGFVLVACLAVYIKYLISKEKSTKHHHSKKQLGHSIMFTVIGLLGVIIGSKLLVNSAITIAEFFGLSEIVIGMTIVALGTSLPELVTSLVAAKKGMQEIAIGNIIGSNMFNISAVLGLSALVKPIAAIPRLFRVDMPIMLVITAVMLTFLWKSKKITYWQGGLLVAMYVGFILSQFGVWALIF